MPVICLSSLIGSRDKNSHLYRYLKATVTLNGLVKVVQIEFQRIYQ